jgi:hypothetical protein
VDKRHAPSQQIKRKLLAKYLRRVVSDGAGADVAPLPHTQRCRRRAYRARVECSTKPTPY